jgi:large subunit ribosomal protein L18
MFDDAKTINRKLRQGRVRDRVKGSEARPRLCVFRSAKHIYVQVISDGDGKTLIAASTLSKDLRETGAKKKLDAAKKVGELIAKKCLEQSISRVVFDRNGFHYHGRVKALAEAAREAGLQF